MLGDISREEKERIISDAKAKGVEFVDLLHKICVDHR